MVTKQVKKKLDKSIEDVNNRIQEYIETLSVNDRISKDQALSMIKKLNLKVPNEVYNNKSSAEYYAKKLLNIDFLDSVKLIFNEILSKPNFSRIDFLEIIEDMRIPGLKIRTLDKIVREKFEFNIWSDSYPIRINPTPDGKGYIVE